MGTAEAKPFLSGLILAAGASRRLGQPKQLLELEGLPLLQHVIDQARQSCLREIVLVLGHRAQEIESALTLPSDCPFRVISNPDHEAGQSSSLQLGLRALDPSAQAAVILLGDQPRIRAETIDELAGHFLSDDRPLLRPVYGTSPRVPGHPVFIARSVWEEIDELRGDTGARKLFEKYPERIREVPMAGNPPSDIDTWDDYQRILEDTPGLK